MTHHRRLLLSLGLLVVLAIVGVGVVAWLTGPKCRVTMRTVNEIQEGMSLKEVERFLGPADGDSETEAVAPQEKITKRSWLSKPYEGWFVTEVFDEQERVANVLLTENTDLVPLQEGLLDTIRRWLRL